MTAILRTIWIQGGWQVAECVVAPEWMLQWHPTELAATRRRTRKI